MKLKVIINSNSHIIYKEGEDYDNWSYDGKSIIIEKYGRLVAVYNLNSIIGACEYEEK